MTRALVSVPVAPRWLRYLGVLTVALVILVGSVGDPPSTGMPPFVLGIPQDKWLHALAYAGLAGTLAYATLTPGARPTRQALGVALLLAVAYGVGIEGVQAFLPARTFDPLDALANAVGASVGSMPWRGVSGSENPTPLSALGGKSDQ